MVNYENLGFESEEEYLKFFYNNLLSTNHTFDYFVNWDKVYKKVKEYLVEISILNSLSKIDKDDLEDEFRNIIACYPEVVPILPAILAIRTKNKDVEIDILEGAIKTYNFSAENFILEDIVYFCKKSGLLNLFNEINDLYAYLLGTEVGLDTNARKNRSGTVFEKLIEKKLISILENTPYNVETQSYVENIDRNKKADFIITKNNKQILFLESNFYSAHGSKPIEVAHAYIELQEEIKNIDVEFLWITDGLGWNKMSKTFNDSVKKIDYVINYSMIEDTINRLLNL